MSEISAFLDFSAVERVGSFSERTKIDSSLNPSCSASFSSSEMEMMSLGMGILPPANPYLSDTNWVLQQQQSNKRGGGSWTLEENKIFEKALAIYDKDTPDRWNIVADMIHGKTVDDVKRHYQELEDDVYDIEAGLVPIPGYSSSSFTVEWGADQVFEGMPHDPGLKRSFSRPDQERKKGVPWTEDEHRLFLMGLKKYGKGDWRNISRNFVLTRTPTQVASHAQKYFIRLGSSGKDKRRSSIHDITTASLADDHPPLPTSEARPEATSTMAVSPDGSDLFSVLTDSNQSTSTVPASSQPNAALFQQLYSS